MVRRSPPFRAASNGPKLLDGRGPRVVVNDRRTHLLPTIGNPPAQHLYRSVVERARLFVLELVDDLRHRVGVAHAREGAGDFPQPFARPVEPTPGIALDEPQNRADLLEAPASVVHDLCGDARAFVEFAASTAELFASEPTQRAVDPLVRMKCVAHTGVIAASGPPSAQPESKKGWAPSPTPSPS